MIEKLQTLLNKKDKQFLLMLFIFSIVVSAIETLGISAIMPFIAVSTDFSIIQTNEYYSMVYKLFNFSSEVEFVITFGVVLILFYILRSLINIFYFYLLSKFTQSRYHILAYRLFENYMGLPYTEFVNKNSSTMTKSIVNEAANLTSLISASLIMMTEIINPIITFVITIILFLNALLMLKTISAKIKKIGKIRAEAQKKFYEIVNRSFGNFKLIKLQSNDKDVLDSFKDASLSYSHVNITNATLAQIPRFFLEAIGFSIILSIIIYLVWNFNGNISEALPVITMFVLALYRLMPSVNRIMTSYNQILFQHKSLNIIHSDLMYPMEDLGDATVNFNNNIIVKNLNFEYESNKLILDDINLTISKGSSIAFVGESGSGKSTLVDIITGLYKPKSGDVCADDTIINDMNIKSWRSKIGYIPQSVYLFDGTVAENVAFGATYNKEKIDDVLKKAKIYDFLQSKKGQNTFVGEGGIMLSGGQKQRIAIARALYTDPEVLVLDEATSALDDSTEKEIMSEIYDISHNKTLIIIAHRLTTLYKCDIIYKIQNGKIENVQ